KFQNAVFFGKAPEYKNDIKEPFLSMKLATAALAFICVAGGLLLLSPARTFLTQAVDVLVSGVKYKDLILAAVK
ncbi:MAG: hypothetical protein WC417_00070, partial [Candidatus Omnitrophota bacterium]